MFSIKTCADIHVRGLTEVLPLCITMGIDFNDLSKNKAHTDIRLHMQVRKDPQGLRKCIHAFF